MFIYKSPEEQAKQFEKCLLDTNRGFNYYVNWNNIDGYQEFEIELHAMDVLIGCSDDRFDFVFAELLKKIPTVVATFPYLFALSKAERNSLREGKSSLKIIGTELDGDFEEYCFSVCDLKSGLPDEQIARYYSFFKQMGLKHLFQNLLEKSVVDYVVGVLVGLDSNGRKNRGGTAFELACETMVTEVCKKYGIEVLFQKQFSEMREYGFDVSEDIAERKADFILFVPATRKCMNIEVNFYNGGGSKPEEIIDSYINRQTDLEKNGIGFALITDGGCWRNTPNQLAKGFRKIKHLMNFKLAKEGMLEEAIRDVFLR